MTDKKKVRGQFFTVDHTVQDTMVELLNPHEDWRVLEPSAGAGDLMVAVLEHHPHATVTGWELDSDIAKRDGRLVIDYGDFFNLAQSSGLPGGSGKFHSIIGNPPFVAWKNVEPTTQMSAAAVKSKYSDKTNLYHLFIDRCIDLLEDGGEMVLIVPKEWTYATSALPLRKKLLENGRITHFIDGGEEKVFPDADVPAIIIFRYQKNSMTDDAAQNGTGDATEIGINGNTIQHRHGFTKNLTEWTDRQMVVTAQGYWLILSEREAETVSSWNGTTLSDALSVKVGIVSGADKVFNVTSHPDLTGFLAEGSALHYVTTKGVETFIDLNHIDEEGNIPPLAAAHLAPHREALLKRGIAKFTEKNWWKYGAVRNRAAMESGTDRIYCYGRTRSNAPFFITPTADTVLFSGGVLGLFPVKGGPYDAVSIDLLLRFLNSGLFRSLCVSLGLTTGSKVSLQPSTLGAIPFPPVETLVEMFGHSDAV